MLAMKSGKGTCSLQLHGNYSKKLYHSILSKPVYPGKFFNNAPIRRIAIAMNTNSAVPFKNQQFLLKELIIIRGGRAIISLDTTSLCHPYVTTMK